ncbi:TonB-dependent receptor [Xanthomonas campestris pv. raphani]|uniref:TonB-dependent receptor n=1 Tax=Xanthomonas campestris TaxID=339 RepID=UPI002368F187|nr:TonB-dependent receptor [Xanthomonas campestris]MEA9822734.1 TonB-dependent receptor [Xanthomonas campestris pv. raphani]MEA9851075.1 TonB-dependent receptor [Xanthomonas campestris pv. raphani]MEA9855281.1 TonB-dependent receptor [Xanthomonas campestris pv. raphani]MEA9964207.1 TonB-dependent receptor [Xanthomonas campestris pv. raphani]WDJ23750.1 TonB-dependent receptor [Xanthomonas campestris pv. raphani]
MTSSMPRYALSLAIGALLAPLAHAQTASPDAGKQDATTLDAVIVSGTARFKGLAKRDASFSITTASPEQIQQAVPQSTADLLKIVPGVWAEPSGGGTGANIFVRGMPSEGDAPFVTMQLDGSPLFPPPTLSFLENSTLFRVDDTVERMEVLRGGSSPIFSNGQPGLTVNFIQKKGQDAPEGSVRLTGGNNALRRIDVFNSGPMGNGWYYSIGGFFRETDGVRDPQFSADKGGQFSATLSKRWDSGELSFYARHTDDNNAFYTAIPLLSRNNGNDLSSFPGLNAQTGTLLGRDFRNVDLLVGPNGETIQRDLADGRGVNIDVFGGELNWDVGGWTVADRFNVMAGTAPTYALFTGDAPQRLGDFIAGYGTTGSGRFTNGGGAVDPNQQVLEAGWWSVDKRLNSFTNDLRLSRELFAGNTLTVGAYYAKYSSADTWYLGNTMLLTAQNNARRIDVDLADGRQATRQGFTSTAFLNLRANYDGENIAAFVADEWELSERLRLDLGARYERQSVTGDVHDTATVDLDGNPATVYDNATSLALASTRRIDQDDEAFSWTAGLNFRLNDNNSLFARANSGVKFPGLDNLRDGQTRVQDVDQYELGLKSGASNYDLYLTAFYNTFKNSPFQAFLANGENFTAVGDSRARGLEVEGAIRPFGGFELAGTGVWLDAKYRNYREFTGNQVMRQPKRQFRVTPSYYWMLPFGDLKVFATYSYIGDRFADLANSQRLPSYDMVDIGANLHVGDHWEVTASGSNVTDTLGLTEGNVRVPGAATGGVFMGRPIAGRQYQMSVAYRW